MSVLVDTSVWSLAFRRDFPPATPELDELRRLLVGGDVVITTGFVLQELLQGFVPRHAQEQILARFASVPVLVPSIEDHVGAASVRNTCRIAGVQLGTIDALLAQLAIVNKHTLLTADRDFVHAAPHIGLPVWQPR